MCFDLLAADKAKSSDVTLHFYFPAQRIMNGARLRPALYVALWHWHRFLASDQEHFERLVPESRHTFHMAEAYLVARHAYGDLCGKQPGWKFNRILSDCKSPKNLMDMLFDENAVKQSPEPYVELACDFGTFC